MKRIVLLATLVMMVATVAAPVAAQPATGYFVDETKLPFEALDGATAQWGVLGNAGYRIEVPDDWNGDLVLWAHGFRGEGLELTVDNHPLRELLIAQGYAWAASSYSRNDYDVGIGVSDTLALTRYFDRTVGRADIRYITGASMGGQVTAVIAETAGRFFDGALPVCGAIGDYELFDYFLDFNVAAQQIGTGTSEFPVDTATYVGVTVPSIKANLEAVEGGWPVVLNEDGENFKNLVELRSGGDRPNFDEGWAFWNTFPEFATGPGNFLFDLGLGDGSVGWNPRVVVDNTDAVYQFDTDPALSAEEQAFNDNVVRVAAGAKARVKFSNAPVPIVNGDPAMPVLTLHNLGDLFVPILNEVVYANEVAANGSSDLLVQRAIRGVGHCDFTPEEFSTAFLDLVAWVETGVKPDGDNFLDPAAVADPDFGCAFTVGDHLLATPCDSGPEL
ncbi:MAG TPA: phthalyl amidase [Actinobacteria bacterium]|nr:phthalyl amidase [Actinomycetota bacterium]